MSQDAVLFESGKPVGIEVVDLGVFYPVSHSFKDVNNFVHDVGVDFDSLLNLCLGLSAELEKVNKVALELIDFELHTEFEDRVKNND